ncbi:MAG: gliding motility-associated C-terminal domain-containing protein [Bacteroidales bacterium]
MKSLLRYSLLIVTFLSLSLFSMAQLTVDVTVDKHVSCPGGDDGKLTIVVSNGTAEPMSVLVWNTTIGVYDFIPIVGPSATINLPDDGALPVKSGSFIVFVSGPSANKTADPFEVFAPDDLTFSTTQPTCAVPTGTIQINTPIDSKGDVYSFHYSVDGGTSYVGTPSFPGLEGGQDYNLRVEVTTQATAKCTLLLNDVTIYAVPPTPDPIQVFTTHPSCANPLGSIEVLQPLSGGGVTYEYSKDIAGIDWQDSELFPNLAADSYLISARNKLDHSCITSHIYTLIAASSPPAAPNLSATHPACGGPDKGTITVNTPAGVDYEYNIDGGAFQASPIFPDLDPGTYNIRVRLVSDPTCVSDPTSETINAPAGAPEIDNVTHSDPTTVGGTEGSITVNLDGGTGTPDYTYYLTGTSSANSGEISATSYTFTGLGAGTYTVYVTDAASCTSASVTDIILTAPGGCTNAVITLTTGNNNQGVCNGDAISDIVYTITGDYGAVSVSGLPAGVSYSEVGGTLTISGTPSATGSSSYTVTVDGAGGCAGASANGTIQVSELPTITIEYEEDPYCKIPGTTATVTINGEIINYVEATYSGGNLPTDFNNLDNFTSSSCPGDLTVTIPIGATITGVDVEYEMWAVAFPPEMFVFSQQRSYLSCVSAGGVAESEVYKGVGNTSGVYQYNRTGLDIANGVVGGGDINFELHAGRTWPTGGCSVSQHRVNNNTWKVRVYYADTHLFTAEPAGLAIDPITGEVDLDASDSGTYTVTYHFSDGVCSGTTTTTITIDEIPETTISYDDSPYCAQGVAAVSYGGPAYSGTFTSTDGLSINSSTGEVNLEGSTPGIYTVTYNYTDGKCSNEATAIIEIKGMPQASILYEESPYCGKGIATVTFTGDTGGTYSSDVGLQIDSSTGEVDLEASIPNTYTVEYELTIDGCTVIASTDIEILAIPTTTISYDKDEYCKYEGKLVDVSIDDYPGGTFSGTSGLVIDEATGQIDIGASDAGTHTVTYEFTDGTCTNTTTFDLVIHTLPVATIEYPSSPYCEGEGVATVIIDGEGGGEFSCDDINLDINGSSGEINLTTSPSGTYTIEYRFQDPFTLCFNITTAQVVINANPTPTISTADDLQYCAGEAIGTTFTIDIAGDSYQWLRNDVAIAGATNPTYTATEAGEYTVAVTDDGCEGTSNMLEIIVKPLPEPTISTLDGLEYCAGETISTTFTIDIAGDSYQWLRNDVAIAGATDPTYTATAEGNYSVDVTTSGCTGLSNEVSVVLNPLPVATISYEDDEFCRYEGWLIGVTVSDYPGGSFSGTDGLAIDESSGQIDIGASDAGSHTVTYEFTDGICTNTATFGLYIHALPEATIEYSESPYCEGLGIAQVTLIGIDGGIFSCEDTNLDIDPISGDINLETSIPGTYTVEYRFQDIFTGCFNKATTLITINDLPQATISFDDSPYCATGVATVTITGDMSGEFSCDNADLIIDIDTGEVDLEASASGTYTVNYTLDNEGCVNTVTTEITIIELPTAIISGGGNYCEGNTLDDISILIDFTGTPPFSIVYAINGADQPAITDINVMQYSLQDLTLSGTYTLTSVTNEDCIGSVSGEAEVIEISTIAPTGPANQEFCAGATIADIEVTGTDVKWYDAPVGGVELANDYMLVNGESYYATQNLNGCESINRLAVTVEVNPILPVSVTIAADPGEEICEGTSVTFTATPVNEGVAPTYQWILNGGNVGDDQPTYTTDALANGDVVAVILTSSETCTLGSPATSNEITVVVNEIPTAEISGGGSFCEGSPTTGVDVIFTFTGTSPWSLVFQRDDDEIGPIPSGDAVLVLENATVGTYSIVSVSDAHCPGIILGDNEVVVTEKSTDPPTGSSPQYFCAGATIADIVVTGEAITWYDAPNGNILNMTDILVDGETYYATQTAEGCESTDYLAVEVYIPLPLIIGTPNVQDVLCFGDASGKVTVSVSGGSAPYTFTLYDNNDNVSDINNDGVFENVAFGNNYYIGVDDKNGCGPVFSTVFDIDEPDPIVIDINSIVVTPISTFGATDGAIFLSASGGTGDLYYTLTKGGIVIAGPQLGNGIFTGLANGDYIVEVTDDRNCGPVFSDTITVLEPLIAPLKLTGTPASCYGACDGTITVNDDQGLFTLDKREWFKDGEDISAEMNGKYDVAEGLYKGICAGTYKLDVEINGEVQTDEIVISEPAPMTITSLDIYPLNCFGINKGEISIWAKGDTLALEYRIEGPLDSEYEHTNNSGIFTNLAAGSYKVFITDGNGCTQAFPEDGEYEITQPDEIVITTVTDISLRRCHDDTIGVDGDGIIEMKIEGGTGDLGEPGDYTYSWNKTEGDSIFLNYPIPGIYELTVTDKNQCVAVKDVVIPGPEPIIITFEYDTADCRVVDVGIGNVNGGINISAITGGNAESAGDYSLKWYRGTNDEHLTDFDNKLHLKGRQANEFYAVVTDLEGCIDKTDFAIPVDENNLFDVLITKDNNYCYRDQAYLTALVETPNLISIDSYRWVNVTDNPDIENKRVSNVYTTGELLHSTLFRVDAVSKKGCIESAEATLSVYPRIGPFIDRETHPFFVDSDLDAFRIKPEDGESYGDSTIISLLADTEYPIEIFTENADYTLSYSWTPVIGFNPSDEKQTVMIFRTGEYQSLLTGSITNETTNKVEQYIPIEAIVTSQHQCTEIVNLKARILDKIKNSNVFSPNGDGINDRWTIPYSDVIPNLEIKIYNRWGALIWSAKGSEASKGWDGKNSRGKDLSIGTYYYVISYNVAGTNKWKPISGSVTIIR